MSEASSAKRAAREVYRLEFALDVSRRYHQQRRRFFSLWHNTFSFLTIAAGSAAFGNLLELHSLFGALAAVLAALDLTLGISHRARDHEILYRRFSDLASLTRRSELKTDELIRGWQAKRIEIEMDEPPVYNVIIAKSHNEATEARGLESTHGLFKLNAYQRILGHFFTFDGIRFGTTKIVKEGVMSLDPPTEQLP